MACALISFTCVCVCASKRSDACGRRVRSLIALHSPKCWRQPPRYLFSLLSSRLLVFHLQSVIFRPQNWRGTSRFSLTGTKWAPETNTTTLKEEWQKHIILLSYFFQLLTFFWPHYLLYAAFHLFYSHPLHLCSSIRLLVCYSLVLITLITSLTLLLWEVRVRRNKEKGGKKLKTRKRMRKQQKCMTEMKVPAAQSSVIFTASQSLS